MIPRVPVAGVGAAPASVVVATALGIDAEGGALSRQLTQRDRVAVRAAPSHSHQRLRLAQHRRAARGHAARLTVNVIEKNGVSGGAGQKLEQPGESLRNGSMEWKRSAKPLADGLFQFDDAVGDITDDVGYE